MRWVGLESISSALKLISLRYPKNKVSLPNNYGENSSFVKYHSKPENFQRPAAYRINMRAKFQTIVKFKTKINEVAIRL